MKRKICVCKGFIFKKQKKKEKEKKIISIVEIKEKQICYGMYFVDLFNLMEKHAKKGYFLFKI